MKLSFHPKQAALYMSLCLAHTHSCKPIHILADFTAFCFPGRNSSCCRKITVKGGKRRTTEVQLSCLACSKRGGAVGVRNHFFLLCCQLSLMDLFIGSWKEQTQKALSGILCTEQRGPCEKWNFIRGLPGLAALLLDHPDTGKEAAAISCWSVHSKPRKTRDTLFPRACFSCPELT